MYWSQDNQDRVTQPASDPASARNKLIVLPLIHNSTTYFCCNGRRSGWCIVPCRTLNLTNTQLSGTLPASWAHAGAFRALQELHLGGDIISGVSPLTGSLPAEWGSRTAFPALRLLWINCCNISGMAVQPWMGQPWFQQHTHICLCNSKEQRMAIHIFIKFNRCVSVTTYMMTSSLSTASLHQSPLLPNHILNCLPHDVATQCLATQYVHRSQSTEGTQIFLICSP